VDVLNAGFESASEIDEFAASARKVPHKTLERRKCLSVVLKFC
jgi:hypothetical protein